MNVEKANFFDKVTMMQLIKVEAGTSLFITGENCIVVSINVF